MTNAADSVDQYAQYVQLRDAGHEAEANVLLQEIADYNEYDCVSTLRLRDWLLDLATPYRAKGSPDLAVTEDPDDTTNIVDELSALEEQIRQRAGDPFNPGRSDEERAWGLAGAALRFHQREEKSFWWEHFARLSEPVEEWADNRNIFHVTGGTIDRDWSKATIRARTLTRDLTLTGYWSEGSTPSEGAVHLIHSSSHQDPASRQRDCSTGKILSTATLSIEVTESLKGEEPHESLPIAVAPGGPPPSQSLRDAIRTWVEDANARGALPKDPIGDLFQRKPSRLIGGGKLAPADADNATSAVVDSILRLDNSYLAVQGPPGTGKTYVAANAIVRLVRDHGWKVGVVAQSHKVIDNVLKGVVDYGLDPHLIGKAQGPKHQKPEKYTAFANNLGEAFLSSQPRGAVIGGTAWLFAKLPPGALDLVVVDEAGQYSLANTLISATRARNLLLVGDPQQLPQVSVGTHPEPVVVSALGFLSEGHDVLPAEFGYFLAQSRRMDSRVTKPVSELSYDGELVSHPSTDRRQLTGVERGLQPVPVQHHGNVTSSPEEADRVLHIIKSHLGTTWFDGIKTWDLDQGDIIVVTPYNAQVAMVKDVLDGAGLTEVRVGTVDKFQGQEAVLAITTLAASSAAEVPRGLGFLLMRNRLNVSISRAQWKSFLVYSPALLDHLPNTPDGLAEMSAFAQLVSTEWGRRGPTGPRVSVRAKL